MTLSQGDKTMRCVICKQGQTNNGHTTVTLERADTTVVIKDVPAQICENCGEYYLSEEVTEKVHNLAQQAFRQGAEIEILRYAA
jgi:YgiT-type zinc finger domain-containing protein